MTMPKRVVQSEGRSFGMTISKLLLGMICRRARRWNLDACQPADRFYAGTAAMTITRRRLKCTLSHTRSEW
ncbi:MAG: hypothetical protein B7Z55_07620 [Planctomycetales bacterium 12-60-4]|nr:MAG: hypothetical protein B7Z55_07620 [Planctomycetales bacterium 12-60-4]